MIKKVLIFFNYLLKLNDNKEVTKIVLILIFSYSLFFLLLTLLFFNDYSSYFTASFYFNIFDNISQNLLRTLPEIALFLFFEELFFRLPIIFFINKNIGNNYKILLISILSLFFSFAHLLSFSLVELLTIPNHFIFGIMLSLIFILTGANKGKIIVPFVFIFLFHLLWNLLVFSVQGFPII